MMHFSCHTAGVSVFMLVCANVYENSPLLYILPELHEKEAASALYNGEIEDDIRKQALINECVYFQDSDREKHMQRVLDIYKYMLYPHSVCSDTCQQRG